MCPEPTARERDQAGRLCAGLSLEVAQRQARGSMQVRSDCVRTGGVSAMRESSLYHSPAITGQTFTQLLHCVMGTRGPLNNRLV